MQQLVTDLLSRFSELGSQPAFWRRRGLRTVSWSYEKIAIMSHQFARELELRKIQKGDRVLMRAESGPEWITAFFGCVLRGAILVPVDVHSTQDFVHLVQKQVESRLTIFDSEAASPAPINIPQLDLALTEEMIAGHSDQHHAEPLAPSDPVEIVYTSGTTAEPRGVVLTHRNLLSNLVPLQIEVEKFLRWEPLVHPLRLLSLVPLSHVFGQLMGMFVPPLFRGQLIFQSSLNASDVIRTIKRHRVSILVAVPRVLETLRYRVETDWERLNKAVNFQQALESSSDCSLLKRLWAFRNVHQQFGWKFWAIVSGGATLSESSEDFWQTLGYAVIQGYGMTETASIITVNHPFKKARGSVGKTLPGHEVMIDSEGQILVRGDHVSPGYWSKANQAPANVQVRGHSEQAGKALDQSQPGNWLATGDLGEIREDGKLYFRGRKKDIIVTSGGLNIFPEDLEKILKLQPGVRDAVVIEFQGPHGPEPAAVLLMHNAGYNEKVVIETANETLAAYQQIRRWCVWPEHDFPRTSTQKPLKRMIAETARALANAQPSPIPAGPGNETLTTIARLVHRISGELPGKVDREANIATDLRLDSLARVELINELEHHFQVELDEAAFTSTTTVGDLEHLIACEPDGSGSTYPYAEWSQHFPWTWIRFFFLYVLILPTVRLLSWFQTAGLNNLWGISGPVLFVSNHITMADHALILGALPFRFRHKLIVAMDGERLRGWRYPGKDIPLYQKVAYYLSYVITTCLFNVFPLPKKSGFRRSFLFAGEAMDRGYSVLVFPEGERSQDGLMHPFMTGIGVLARDLGVPCVPLKILGLYELKARKRRMAIPGEVSIVFGPKIQFGISDEPVSVAERLHHEVASL